MLHRKRAQNHRYKLWWKKLKEDEYERLSTLVGGTWYQGLQKCPHSQRGFSCATFDQRHLDTLSTEKGHMTIYENERWRIFPDIHQMVFLREIKPLPMSLRQRPTQLGNSGERRSNPYYCFSSQRRSLPSRSKLKVWVETAFFWPSKANNTGYFFFFFPTKGSNFTPSLKLESFRVCLRVFQPQLVTVSAEHQ